MSKKVLDGDQPMGLSLAAELLLLSIDGTRGGLLPHRRTRLLRSLAVAARPEAGHGVASSLRGLRVRRAAAQELQAAGLVRGRGIVSRLQIADKSATGVRVRGLLEAVSANEDPTPRIAALMLFLSWMGVLGQRLSRHERRHAARHLRRLSKVEPAPILGAQAGEGLANLGVGSRGGIVFAELGSVIASAGDQLVTGGVSGPSGDAAGGSATISDDSPR